MKKSNTHDWFIGIGIALVINGLGGLLIIIYAIRLDLYYPCFNSCISNIWAIVSGVCIIYFSSKDMANSIKKEANRSRNDHEPYDGATVRFILMNGTKLIGEYIESDKMFYVDEFNFFYQDQVIDWKYLPKKPIR